jgi:hypothetical protein
VDPPKPPKPPKPRRMKANDKVGGVLVGVRTYHGVEHDEDRECNLTPACEPVDPPPKFEARIYPVLVDEDGNAYLEGAGVPLWAGQQCQFAVVVKVMNG